MNRVVLVVVVAALGGAVEACEGSDDCSPGESRCDGNVLLTCGGEAGTTTWDRANCGDAATCLGSRCYANPPRPCTADKVGYGSCNRSLPEVCTADGYWWGDPAGACNAAAGETCQTGLDESGGTPVPTSLCALELGNCNPATSGRSCQNDVLIECAAAGLWVRVQDCSTGGGTCAQGACQGR